MPVIYTLYVIVIIFIAYRQHKRRNQQKEEVPVNRTEPDHWLTEWLREQKLGFEVKHRDVENRYSLDVTLHSCRVLLFIREHKTTGDFIADIAFPVVIADERFAQIGSLIKSYQGRVENTKLLLDKNAGLLHLRMEWEGKEFQIKSPEEKACELYRLFYHTDQIFPEFMHILYGNGIPETAAAKLFGFRDYEMN